MNVKQMIKVDTLTKRQYAALSTDVRADIDELAGDDLMVWLDMVHEQYQAKKGNGATAAVAQTVQKTVQTEENPELRNRSGKPIAHVDYPETWTWERMDFSPIRDTKDHNNPTALENICRDGIGADGFNYNSIYNDVEYANRLKNPSAVGHRLAQATAQALLGKVKPVTPPSTAIKQRLMVAMELAIANPDLAEKDEVNGKAKQASHKPKDSAVSLPARDDEAAVIADLQREIATLQASLNPVTEKALTPMLAEKQAQLAELIGDAGQADLAPKYTLDNAQRELAKGKLAASRTRYQELADMIAHCTDTAFPVGATVSHSLRINESFMRSAEDIAAGRKAFPESWQDEIIYAAKYANFIGNQAKIQSEYKQLRGKGVKATKAREQLVETYNIIAADMAHVRDNGGMSPEWVAGQAGSRQHKDTFK